jgi:hypothetical protein
MADHLRLVRTDTSTMSDDAPLQPGLPTMADLIAERDALLAENAELRARLAAAEQRAGEVPGLYRQIGALLHANNEHRQQNPRHDGHAEYAHPVAALLKTLPPGIVSPQAVHAWLISGEIDAQQIGSRWHVKDPSDLYDRIEAHAKRNGKQFARPE